MKETKEARFRRVAEARVNKLIGQQWSSPCRALRLRFCRRSFCANTGEYLLCFQHGAPFRLQRAVALGLRCGGNISCIRRK